MVLVTDDLTKKVKAGDLIKELASLVGARGGGRPHMAQAGGGDPAKLTELLAKAPEVVSAALG
jgi:alanyl-tRNA synthetase